MYSSVIAVLVSSSPPTLTSRRLFSSINVNNFVLIYELKNMWSVHQNSNCSYRGHQEENPELGSVYNHGNELPIFSYLNILVLIPEVLSDELHSLGGLVRLRGEEDVRHVAVPPLPDRRVVFEWLTRVQLAARIVQLGQLHHLYLVLHLFWKMFPAGSTGEVFGQFWWGRREVSRHPPLWRVVPAGGRGKTTCGGVTALHLHHPP